MSLKILQIQAGHYKKLIKMGVYDHPCQQLASAHLAVPHA